jgi:hypothetical protein
MTMQHAAMTVLIPAPLGLMNSVYFIACYCASKATAALDRYFAVGGTDICNRILRPPS